jgi:hypothetical protein
MVTTIVDKAPRTKFLYMSGGVKAYFTAPCTMAHVIKFTQQEGHELFGLSPISRKFQWQQSYVWFGAFGGKFCTSKYVSR